MMARKRSKDAVEPVFSPEDADLAALKWRANWNGYPMTALPPSEPGGKRRCRTAHRIVIERAAGRVPAAGEWCDHANGNKLDCRRSNLRLVSPSQSAQNRVRRNKHGRNVTYIARLKKYRASVYHRRRHVYVGMFSTAEAAAEAARAKRVELGFLEREA